MAGCGGAAEDGAHDAGAEDGDASGDDHQIEDGDEQGADGGAAGATGDELDEEPGAGGDDAEVQSADGEQVGEAGLSEVGRDVGEVGAALAEDDGFEQGLGAGSDIDGQIALQGAVGGGDELDMGGAPPRRAMIGGGDGLVVGAMGEGETSGDASFVHHGAEVERAGVHGGPDGAEPALAADVIAPIDALVEVGEADGKGAGGGTGAGVGVDSIDTEGEGGGGGLADKFPHLAGGAALESGDVADGAFDIDQERLFGLAGDVDEMMGGRIELAQVPPERGGGGSDE